MRIIIPFVFDQLRQMVLDKAGLTIITPSDCRSLSFTICRSTNKQISDTTLKRIYGFASNNSTPSLYTLNALSEFCGYSSWESFGDQFSRKHTEKKEVLTIATDSPEVMFRKVSYGTLQVLKNKSIIPYQQTISREFVNEHLDIFISSDYHATVLAAPAGYGKTVALCHWVEEKLISQMKGESEEHILFLSGKALAGLSNNITLNDWLLALAGMPTGRKIDAIGDWLQNEKLYIIIDEFDFGTVREDQFEILFEMLQDLIAINNGQTGFKIILTMRSSSWAVCQQKLKVNNRLDEWFLGFMNDESNRSNMHVFSSNEIKQLCQNLNSKLNIPEQLHPEVISLFSYPLFFQYYYQKYPNSFCLTKFDHFGIYEVVSSYCEDKLQSTKYATERILLLRILIEYGEFVEDSFLIDKLKVYHELKLYKEAYDDLLSIGFLREKNLRREVEFGVYIEFGHLRILTNCIAKKLIRDNGGEYDENLCYSINQKIPEGQRLQVLKWCIFNAVKSNQYGLFNQLSKVVLSASKKAILISFLSNLIDRNFLLPPRAPLNQFNFDENHKDLFYYFFGIEFVSTEYGNALKGLLKLDLNVTNKIWIHTCLAIIGVIQLDCAEVEYNIAALKGYDEDAFNCFVINPLYCIETLYYYFKYGIVKKDALAQITHFCFNPHKAADSIGANHILYLLALATLGIGNNKKKTIRFINVLKEIQLSKGYHCANFEFFLNITLADAYFMLGEVEKGVRIQRQLQENYKKQYKNYTPYMKNCLDFLSAQVFKYTGKLDQIEAIIESILTSADKSGNWLMIVNALSFYLSCKQVDKSDMFYKTVYLKFIKKVRSSEFNPQRFLFDYEN